MNLKLKTIPFTLAQKKEILRHKSNKAQNLYEKNYKILMREIKDLGKWTDVPCPWAGRLSIVKMSAVPNSSCRVNAGQSKS